MKQKKFNPNKWIRNWIKKNNVDHAHGGRYVMVTGGRDAGFLHNELGKNEWPLEETNESN